MIRVICIGVVAATCAFGMAACGTGGASRTTLGRNAASVVHAIASLGSDVEGAQSDLPNFPADLESERKDLAITYGDLETERTDGAIAVCRDAATVRANAADVETDVSLMQDDIHSFVDDAGRATNAITQLSTDDAEPRHGIKTSDYTPAATPTLAAVGSEISAANTELATARSAVASYLQTAHRLVGRANGYAARAQAICVQRGS